MYNRLLVTTDSMLAYLHKRNADLEWQVSYLEDTTAEHKQRVIEYRQRIDQLREVIDRALDGQRTGETAEQALSRTWEMLARVR